MPAGRKEETRIWLETGSGSSGVVKGPTEGTIVEELTKMRLYLQIAQTRRMVGVSCGIDSLPNDRRCIWCNGFSHVQRDCAEFTDALRNNVVYLQDDIVYASDMWRPLKMNFGQGGIKRIMEEATTQNVDSIHYST